MKIYFCDFKADTNALFSRPQAKYHYSIAREKHTNLLQPSWPRGINRSVSLKLQYANVSNRIWYQFGTSSRNFKKICRCTLINVELPSYYGISRSNIIHTKYKFGKILMLLKAGSLPLRQLNENVLMNEVRFCFCQLHKR